MTDNLTQTIERVAKLLKEKMLECKTYRELAEALIAEGLTVQHRVKPMDCSDDGISRWVCTCGHLMHRQQEYCDKCGAKLLFGEEKEKGG